jgi:uncharacterized protein
MAAQFSRAGALGAAKSSRSAPKGSLHRRFSETCPSAAITGFSKGLRVGYPLLRPSVCGLLRAGTEKLRTANWFYSPPQTRLGRGAQPPQAPVSRGRSRQSGSAESAVLHRHQSAPQSSQRPSAGSGARSGTAVSPVQWLVIQALRAYKFAVSPMLPAACRFHPSCSEYMREAVEKYGALRGGWMGLRRLARCHPFHAGGFDPVR